MKRSQSNDRPLVHRVEHIPLPEGKLKLRTLLLIALLLVAAGSFAYGVSVFVGAEPGIEEISVLSGEMNCGGDFTFYYNLGCGELSAADEKREVRALYSRAAVDALEIFSTDGGFEGRRNLWYVNSHPGEAVAVEPALYAALRELGGAGARWLYLGPLYELNRALTASTDDSEAALYDPRLDEAAGEFAARCAAYAADSAHIELELLGENTVRLRLSEEYAAFCEENGVARYLDFGWLKNAFICDYICSELAAGGFTHGALVSYDGFMRSLDAETGAEYGFDYTHREGGTVKALSRISFGGTASVVYLRDYPVGDARGYYIYADGAIRSPYIDPADGLDRTAASELAVCAFDRGCADLALSAAGAFIGGSFDMDALEALANSGVTVYYTSAGGLETVPAA